MNSRIVIFSICLAFSFTAPVLGQQPAAAPLVAAVKAEKYYRTELYMGMSIPGGAMVSDADWEQFLGEFVTPLFPKGFSVLSGRGQYREASGTIAKEPSKVLVFLYPKAGRKEASTNIERIRSEYKKRFAQESVMRVDITKSVSVSF